MIERDKLLNSLNACRHEIRYDCKKDCIFYEIGSAECIEMLMDAVHEYIGDLEDARKERDQLAEENQNLLKRLPVWKRVEDEKPPYNTQVKIWTNEGFEYIGVYTYSKEFITDGFIELTHKVTHWMHLDEAPTAGACSRPTETGEDEKYA